MTTNLTTNDDPEKILKAIYDWIDEKEMYDFDTEFIDSLSNRLDRDQEITYNQLKALINICDGFNIGE